MSPAVSRAPLEAEDSPAVAEANAAIDMALAMIGANIDGARELAANYGEAAAAVFDARLRALLPQPKPVAPAAPAAPDLLAGMPADLTDPLVLAQVVAVCSRMQRRMLAKGEHDGIAALGRYAALLGQHIASLKAAAEGQAA